MDFIDDLARQIGYAVLGLPIIALLIWVAVKSPLLQWALKIAFLIAWGLLIVGATLLVIVAIHLPKSNYGAAVAALVVGGLISVFWFVIGLPELLKSFKSTTRKQLAPWE